MNEPELDGTFWKDFVEVVTFQLRVEGELGSNLSKGCCDGGRSGEKNGAFEELEKTWRHWCLSNLQVGTVLMKLMTLVGADHEDPHGL